MNDLAFPKPESRKKSKRKANLAKRQNMATFHFQVLARDGYRCMAKEVGCQCVGGLETHHIIYRSQGGTDTVENGITLCPIAHDRVHKGTRVLGIMYPGRVYMLQILKRHVGRPYFRWHEALKQLERDYGNVDDSKD